jgi:hypothetical protein
MEDQRHLARVSFIRGLGTRATFSSLSFIAWNIRSQHEHPQRTEVYREFLQEMFIMLLLLCMVGKIHVTTDNVEVYSLCATDSYWADKVSHFDVGL